MSPSPNLFTDSRVLTVPVPPAVAFRAVENIGGETGWYALNWLWRLRGLLDVLVGGVGMRRSGTRAATLAVGDEVDFWRVETVVPNRLLRLKAEMILPGEAWLEFEITGDGSASTIRQTATFLAHGLAGRLYWYAVFPLHELVFRGMLRGIAGASQRGGRES